MLFRIVLLVFGVPLIAIVTQNLKSNRERNSRLEEIQMRLAKKREEDIRSKLAAMKDKSHAKDSKPSKKNNDNHKM